jgi:methylmalonyl-CoA/ethylmalonyl-CoA epimerase
MQLRYQNSGSLNYACAMAISLGALGQVSLTVDDVDTAERFYSEALGLRKLYRFGELVFFVPESSILYFRTPDLATLARALKLRGVTFLEAPRLIAPMEDHDLWMAFFKDPAGNPLALMHEAPKGYNPA